MTERRYGFIVPEIALEDQITAGIADLEKVAATWGDTLNLDDVKTEADRTGMVLVSVGRR